MLQGPTLFDGFATGHTPMCRRGFEYAEPNILHIVPRKHSSRFSSNSEADALELLENPEEIFLHYLY